MLKSWFGVYYREDCWALILMVNFESYITMRPQLYTLRISMTELLFQQDGATACKSNASMAVFRGMYP